MSKDHIIPQFILRGFAIDPTLNNKKQKINIYNRDNDEIIVKKIVDSFEIENFNSSETEKYLANNYENYIAKIFSNIKKCAMSNLSQIELSNEDYKLLFRFFTIMWRRNDIQIDKMKELSMGIDNSLRQIFGSKYKDIISQDYKDISFAEYLEKNINTMYKKFYDNVIQKTDDNDETVLKTIKNYEPYILYNTSKIHFILHNTYGTLQYIIRPKETVNESDYPYNMIYPISKDLCFCLSKSKNIIDLEKDQYKIDIEKTDDDDFIKKFLIESYITPTAKTFVVDETNLDIVKDFIRKNDKDKKG